MIAIDQEHAKGIAAVMEERLGVSPTIATSDDPGASDKIGRFANGIAPWIVAVRMVSEGVDIPRLPARCLRDEHRDRACSSGEVSTLGLAGTAHPGLAGVRYMFIPDDVRPADARRRDRRAGAATARAASAASTTVSDGTPPVKRTETERDLSEQGPLFACSISAVPL